MKYCWVTTLLVIFFIGCEKDKFNINKPNVESFVKELKNGTYDCYEKNNEGEKLWLIMPQFTENHIQDLLKFAEDTSHITLFPTNPISSRFPFPEGREYFILSECLLWTIEGVRTGNQYGSLDPYLINTKSPDDKRYKGLTCDEILTVRNFYINWWSSYKNKDWSNKNPLEDTPYAWF